MTTTTYKIRRFRFQGETETVETGLTLEEAQEHCRRDDTHGDGWFDGYDVDEETDDEDEDNPRVSECRHCGRTIIKVEEDGVYAWIDPLAMGDDSVWRETCDSHDTFTAEHEPLAQSV